MTSYSNRGKPGTQGSLSSLSALTLGKPIILTLDSYGIRLIYQQRTNPLIGK